jgi:YesN/AraC family two-component response regulator
MPQESGFDLINWIYQQGLSPVVVILTAYERFSYAHTAIQLHVHSYLTKPVNTLQLEESLQNAIRERKRRKIYPELFTYNQSEESPKDPIDVITDCIRKNLSSPDLNRQLIADVVHMNQDYISTLFSKKMGISLTNYIIDERLKAARVMLATTDYSLKEISYKTGFPSTSYFHRLFKKNRGVTPQSYRNSSK